MVLLLLGVIWAAVLVPPWLQNRREARPTASIRSFHRQLWLLGRTSPGYAAAGRSGSPFGSVSSGVTVYGDDYSDHGYAYGHGHGHTHGAYDEDDDYDHDLDDDDVYAYDDADFDDAEHAAAARVNGVDRLDRAAAARRARVRAGAGAGAGPVSRRVDAFYEPEPEVEADHVSYGDAYGYDDDYGYEPAAYRAGGGSPAERPAGRGHHNGNGYGYGADPAYGYYGPEGADRLDAVDEGDGFADLDGLDPRVGARWADVAEARRQRMPDRSPAELRRRAQGYRRRRRVLSIVLVAALVTAPPAAFVGGTGWWAAQIVADVLLVGYVSLLVQRQRRAIEREEKVHYLAPIRAPRPAVVVLHGGAAR